MQFARTVAYVWEASVASITSTQLSDPALAIRAASLSRGRALSGRASCTSGSKKLCVKQAVLTLPFPRRF